MYYPGTSDDLVVREEMATYSPRDHQRVISKLDHGLRKLYQDEQKTKLEPLPETMVDETEASPTPDLILLDSDAETIPVIIEICRTIGLKKDIQKVVKLIDEGFYGIQEGFVYDYKKLIWYRYRAGNSGVVEESSFSDVLQLDLNTFL